MAMFDEIIALKLAILEAVVRDLLIAQFSGQPDSVSAARAYAELKTAPPSQPDPEMEHKRQEAWNAFLDPIVAALAAQGRRSQP
jgi:hypothetical protein